jgi:hypothetical protein
LGFSETEEVLGVNFYRLEQYQKAKREHSTGTKEEENSLVLLREELIRQETEAADKGGKRVDEEMKVAKSGWTMSALLSV